MIIVLKGADFSKNNLGQVQLKVELTPKQKEMLSQYSSNLTEEEQAAFAVMMNTLDDAGITPKITKLYMPILAGNVGEAFVNLADERFTKDVIPTAENWNLLPKNGIGRISGQASKLYVDFSPLSFSDFHFLFTTETKDFTIAKEHEYVEPMSADTKNMLAGYVGQYKDWFGFSYLKINDTFQNTYTGIQTGLYFRNRFPSNLLGVGFTKDNVLMYNSPNDDTVPILAEYKDTLNIPVPKMSLSGVQGGGMKRVTRLISFGRALTHEEYAIYKGAVDKFLAAFGI